MPQSTIFFRQQKENFDLAAFFKAAAEFIIEPIDRPLTEEKLQLHLDKILHYPNERTAEKDKIKRFLELFCYNQLLDSKIIDATNRIYWKKINVLANQCKQISYCVPDGLKLADSVLDRYHKLNREPIAGFFSNRSSNLLSELKTDNRSNLTTRQ